LSKQFSGSLGLSSSLIAKIYIHPSGKQVLLIPQAVAVAKQYQGVLGGHTP
jgi:hypothetical protein